MGQNTQSFPEIGGTVVFSWSDANLRLNALTYEVTTTVNLIVRIYRLTIQPEPVIIRNIVGPTSGEEIIPGNLRMQEITDPEYPEEGTRYVMPEGLVIEIEVTG